MLGGFRRDLPVRLVVARGCLRRVMNRWRGFSEEIVLALPAASPRENWLKENAILIGFTRRQKSVAEKPPALFLLGSPFSD